MKITNKYKKLAIAIAVLTTCSTAAYADGNAFTPLNFDDNSTPPVAVPVKTQPVVKTNPISKAMAKVLPKSSDSNNLPAANATKGGEASIGNDNIQNAILELDNAQVGIRNDLLNYKSKYSDVDAQYKLIRNERTMLKKQVRSIERRIRDIDNAKERIRKNML